MFMIIWVILVIGYFGIEKLRVHKLESEVLDLQNRVKELENEICKAN